MSSGPDPSETTVVEDPARARRQVIAFVTVTLTASFALEGVMIARGGMDGPLGLLVVPIMWIPAITSFGLRLAFRSGFGDVGWAIKTPRHTAVAVWLWRTGRLASLARAAGAGTA